jgi:hypothetical protein
MRLDIYCVGGTLNPPDDLAGTAHDIRTAISLLRLLRAHDCTHCKLQGAAGDMEFTEVTELSINDALLMLLATLLDPNTTTAGAA